MATSERHLGADPAEMEDDVSDDAGGVFRISHRVVGISANGEECSSAWGKKSRSVDMLPLAPIRSALSGNHRIFPEVSFHTHWYILIVLQDLNHELAVYADSAAVLEQCIRSTDCAAAFEQYISCIC